MASIAPEHGRVNAKALFEEGLAKAQANKATGRRGSQRLSSDAGLQAMVTHDDRTFSTPQWHV